MRTTIQCIPAYGPPQAILNARLRLHRLISTLMAICCLAASLFFSLKTNAQSSCPNDNCTSGDMTITKVELIQANGDPVPLSCTPGQSSLSVKLKVAFDATAQTRYGFLIVGDLYVNNVFSQKIFQCYGNDYTQGSHTETLDQTFSWSCGTTLSLKNVYTAWDNQGPSSTFCSHLNSDGTVNCSGIAPKCRYYADQSFVVAAPLAADFTSLEGACTNQKRTWTFTSTTSGGKTPYSYSWDFGDGTTLSTTSNPVTHEYSGFGNKTVSLTVTDAQNNVSSQSHSISVTACCIPSTPPASASADADHFCPGSSTTLSVIGGSLGTNASWKWYTGSCGGTLVGSGSSLSVSPATTTTYFVRAEGECGTTTCAQVTVHVKTPSTNPTGATAGTPTICVGSSTNIAVSGGSLGTGASWKWYSGSCGGTFVGTGSSISVSPGTTTTYYVRAEGDCGNSACASVLVTVNPASVGGSVTPANTICSGSNSGLLTLGGYVGSIVRWESSSTGSAPWSSISNTAATYTSGALASDTWFRAVVKSGVCDAVTSDAVKITVQQPISNNSISASQTICSGTAPDALMGSTPTGGSGSYTYQWQWKTTGSFANISGANGKDYAPGTLTQTTQYRRTASGGVCGSTTSDPVTITISPESVVYALIASDYCASSSSKGSLALAGSYPGVSYQLKLTNDNSNVQAAIVSDHGETITWNNLDAGTYYVLGTGIAPTYCTSQTANATVHEFDCSYFYTLTQGYYGSKNGKSCLGTTPINTIKYLLGMPNNAVDLVTGSTNSVLVPATDDGAKKLNDALPGGNTPTYLPAGNCSVSANPSCFTYPNYLTKQGKINNVLLSQTITLGLNARWENGKLLLFHIESGWLTTQKMSGCGGTATPVTTCSDNTVTSIKMNQNVVNYLGDNNTVKDLLDLANGVLGGTLIPGQNGVPSYADVNDAVDAINKSFDEGRRFLDYYSEKQTCEMLFPSSSIIVSSFSAGRESTQSGLALTTVEGVSVTAYPNPYTDKINFTVESNVSGQGALQVYNMMGQKIKTVYQGFITSGQQNFTLTLPAQQRANLIYVLTVGDKQITGKLLQLK